MHIGVRIREGAPVRVLRRLIRVRRLRYAYIDIRVTSTVKSGRARRVTRDIDLTSSRQLTSSIRINRRDVDSRVSATVESSTTSGLASQGQRARRL